MGPKKVKEGIEDENYWRTIIEETPLDDETWTVKVILIEAAGSEHDRIYLTKFENYAAEERRFVIKNICKTETIFMINQLGGEKKVKDDNLRVFEEGQSYLKEKKDVPPEIMALIIKHLILKMKEEYLFIKRQRLEVREGMKKESATMVNRVEVKGTVNVKLTEPQDAVPPPNVKKPEQEDVVNAVEIDENKKYNTLLRVRGEEWRDKTYIDDYPTDGPNLYIAVTGFLEPNLAGCLIKVGIPLTAVVQIRIDSTYSSMPSSLFRATKRGQSQTELQTEKSLKFWEDLQQLRINMASANDFKNTAFVVFTPPYWSTEMLSGSTDKIYDEICYLMYDVQDLTRQHMHYLDNMDIITIPEENKMDCYEIFYQKCLDGIPFESVSTYLVLDAVLQAVCKDTSDNNDNTTISSLDDAYNTFPTDQHTIEETRLHQSEKLVKDLITELCKVDSQKKKYRLTNGDELIDYKKPIVLNYGDFCKISTFHLPSINLDNIVYSMLCGFPLNKLWANRTDLSEEMNAKNSFHINMLLSCFDRDDVETAELCRLIHILTCRKIYNNRSSLKKTHILPSTIAEFKKIFLKRSILAVPLNKYSTYKCQTTVSSSFHSSETEREDSNEINSDEDSASRGIKILFDCPDISELVSATEIANQKPSNHIIDEYQFFEDFTGSSAFQVIFDAYNNYNCIDYKYCEVTDCFVMMFYNSHNEDGITREEWRCHISTPLCLQDFFDFVLEEHYDWIKNEEKKYDENILLLTQSEYKNTQTFLTEKSCVENNEVDMDLLMEGSLKYDEIMNVEESDVEVSESKILSSKKTPLSTTDIDSSKSGRKTKSPAIATPKTIRHDSASEANIETPKKPFNGYDLGDRRVEVFGKDSTYFAEDGTRVSSSYLLIIPMNLEYVNLNIVPGNSNYEFWVHNELGEVKCDTIDIRESFRVHMKDQLIMYIKKQLYKVTCSVSNPVSGETIHKVNTLKSPSFDMSDVIPEVFETKSFHSLSVTWPNGLVTETVHETNSAKISHIKQHYLSPSNNLDEDMRCISLEGEVVIFKSNNEIEILKPDSSYIKITKCEKKIITYDNPESLLSLTSSDKSKKGKDKHNKTSAKQSKRQSIEIDKNPPARTMEYELFIEEFENIESNGLRQKWIENNKIDIEKLLIKTATDYCLGEIYSKRMDGVTVLLNKDGVQVVTFPNNTRIITNYIIEDDEIFPEWTEVEIECFSINNFVTQDVLKSESTIHDNNLAHTNSFSSDFASTKIQEATNNIAREDGYISVNIVYTIEHASFTTVTIDKCSAKISIESPNNACVTVDEDNIYEFNLDKQTSAHFDGKTLKIKYEVCSESNLYTECEVKMKSETVNSMHYQQNWLNMTDSSCKKIIADEEGNVNVIEDIISGNILEETNSNDFKDQFDTGKVDNKEKTTEKKLVILRKCEEMWKSKQLKFLILRRDLTCSELIHRSIIERYKEDCRSHPWCSINHFDTFGDQRNILSILTPIRHNESEKWVMESKLSSKPKYLTYKDLVKDSGKGFYHWMRPYKRFQPEPIKPKLVLPERLPRAFVLRTLEQQWKDPQREKLKGAKELTKAILCYRNRLETNRETILTVPVEDRRPEHERRTDDIVQAIANRVYKDLKNRLAEDIQSRAQPTITTKPDSHFDVISKEESDEDVLEEQEIKLLEENQGDVKETESAEATTSNLKRYWNRRSEEHKEELFYKYLLREGSVPPYFRNVLGGAIWWQMNSAADDAVTKAERRHMKCVCDEE